METVVISRLHGQKLIVFWLMIVSLLVGIVGALGMFLQWLF